MSGTNLDLGPIGEHGMTVYVSKALEITIGAGSFTAYEITIKEADAESPRTTYKRFTAFHSLNDRVSQPSVAQLACSSLAGFMQALIHLHELGS